MTEETEAPLRDVFASQGILAVTAALAVVLLHLFAPDYCRDLMEALQRVMAESPPPEDILHAVQEQLAKWFV